MVGAENDIVLVVDPETGETAIQNQSPFDLAIDGYGILSASNALSTQGWTSLQDGGGAGWRESNPSANHLAETNLNATMALDGRSDPIPLGSPFNPDSPERDLIFEYRLSTGEIRVGTVHYGDPVEFGDVAFDCNGDAVVSILDANCTPADQLDGFLTANDFLRGDADGDRQVAFPDFVILADNFAAPGQYTEGDFDKNGTVEFPDFVILAGNFGMTSGGAAAVPEPSSLALAGLAGFALCVRRRPWFVGKRQV
jgi:hypothetical protein